MAKTTRTRLPLIAPALALVTLGGALGAQQRADYDSFDGPLGRVHYDLSRGEVTKVVRPRRVAGVREARAQRMGQRAVVHSFRNTLTVGYFFSGTLGFTELDWSDKVTGYQMINAFVAGYATYAWDPAGGPTGGGGQSTPGPGASMIVSFYTGTTGFCNLGSQVSAFSLVGLPGVTGCIGVGGGAGYTVTAYPAAPSFCLPDGMIGWGYTHTDDRGLVTNGTASGLSGTGPLFVDFSTHEPTGWDDAWDIWAGYPASTSSCTGTYWFGCGEPARGCIPGSFYMALHEHDSSQAAFVSINGTGVNPTDLTATNMPRVGSDFQLDISQPGALVVCASPFPPITMSGPLLFGELLVDLGTLIELKVGGPAFHLLVPCDLGLVGATFHAQSAHVLQLGPIELQLHNRLDCTVGG